MLEGRAFETIYRASADVQLQCMCFCERTEWGVRDEHPRGLQKSTQDHREPILIKPADLSLGGAHSSVNFSPDKEQQCSKLRAVSFGVEARKDLSQAAFSRLPFRCSSCKGCLSGASVALLAC